MLRAQLGPERRGRGRRQGPRETAGEPRVRGGRRRGSGAGDGEPADEARSARRESHGIGAAAASRRTAEAVGPDGRRCHGRRAQSAGRRAQTADAAVRRRRAPRLPRPRATAGQGGARPGRARRRRAPSDCRRGRRRSRAGRRSGGPPRRRRAAGLRDRGLTRAVASDGRACSPAVRRRRSPPIAGDDRRAAPHARPAGRARTASARRPSPWTSRPGCCAMRRRGRPAVPRVPRLPARRARQPRGPPPARSRRGRQPDPDRRTGRPAAGRPRAHRGARPAARRGRRPGGDRGARRADERGRPVGAAQDARGAARRRRHRPLRGRRGPAAAHDPVALRSAPPRARGGREIESDPRGRGLADAPTAGRLARLADGRPGLALAYVRAPEALAARAELDRTLLDMLAARPSERLAAMAGLLSRARDLAAALAATAEPADDTAPATRGAPGPRGRRAGARGTAAAAVLVPEAAAAPAEAGTPDAENGETPPPEEAGPPARSSATERRRGALTLIEVWRRLAIDLARTERGEPAAIHDPALLEEVAAAAGRLGAGSSAAFLVRLDEVGRAIDGNASPELAMDVLALAWPAA